MTDLICFSHLRWDFVWQRPQHLLARMAADYRVLFVEEPVTSTSITEPRLELKTYSYPTAKVTVARLLYPVAQEHWIGHGDCRTQPVYNRLLTDYLHSEQYRDPVLWLYTPMALDFVEAIPHSLLIFDVMDQLAAFKGAPAELKRREYETLRRADIVFTGGVSLYRDKLPMNPNTHLFPSGVDTAHFGQAIAPNTLPVPPELAELSGPVLGYYGVIDERMDLSLLAHVAAAHPEWHIVMVGPVAKIDPADLPQAANIHFLGMRSYDQLPAYLARFDVALIPFALNESTRFVSPTKTLEYMAAHKPIVSTPIHDVIELYGRVVRIGSDAVEFERQIAAALADHSLARQHEENEILAIYAWDHIVRRMKRAIRNCQQGNASRRLKAETKPSHVLPADLASSATAAAAVGGDR